MQSLTQVKTPSVSFGNLSERNAFASSPVGSLRPIGTKQDACTHPVTSLRQMQIHSSCKLGTSEVSADSSISRLQ